MAQGGGWVGGLFYYLIFFSAVPGLYGVSQSGRAVGGWTRAQRSLESLRVRNRVFGCLRFGQAVLAFPEFPFQMRPPKKEALW